MATGVPSSHHVGAEAGLPGPRGLPLLGNLLQVSPTQAHQTFEKWAREYGPVYQFRLGARQIVAVSDPDMIMTLLKERPNQFKRMAPVREIFLEMGIPGVFPLEGEQWKRQRKVWMDALTIHNIKAFASRVFELTERLRLHWLEHDQPRAIVEELMRYTVDVTSLFAFGYDADTINRKADVVQDHLQHLFPAINRRLYSPLPYWQWFKLPADRRLDKALLGVRDFVMPRIAAARQLLAENPALREAPENLVEALIVASEANQNALTDEEIYGNSLGVLLAGEDTTAYTMSWMIHELSRHPRVYQALQQEVDEVLGQRLVLDEPEDLNRLPYLDAVMSETLRLRPVAPVIGMTALEAVQLGGRSYPEGTNFLVPTRVAATDPQQFEDPLSFRPERWLGQTATDILKRPPTPFGSGRRTCPGRNLAQMEVRSVISMLLHNFRMESHASDQVTEKLAFTMGPEKLSVSLSPR